MRQISGRLMPSEGEEQAQILDQANQRLRDAAKWLIAVMAAIAAVLVAGSQLSSIGRLPISWSPQTVDQWRFWIALAGVILALIAISLIVLFAARLLVPRAVTPEQLCAAWDGKSGRWRDINGAVRFLRKNPGYMTPYKSPVELMKKYEQVSDKREAARNKAITARGRKGKDAKASLASVEEDYNRIDDAVDKMASLASHLT